MASDAAKEPQSQALQAFESNLDNLIRLHDLLHSYVRNTEKNIRDASVGISSILPHPNELKPDDIDLITPALNNIQKYTDDLAKNLTFLRDWELVMLISFTEAYLEDVLVALVQKNPDWMRVSTQGVSYAQLLRATSLPALVGQMQRRWAKNIINATPPQWIERLKKFGVTGYESGLGKDMKEVWDKRHLIVHSPRASAYVTTAGFQKTLDVLKAFVDATDRFLIKFLAS